MLLLSLLALGGFTSVANAAGTPTVRRDWHHPVGHPIERMFKRDTAASPTVGSPAWTSQYPNPNANFPPANLPSPWVNTLNAAVSAGKIPNIPVPTMGAAGSPVYPSGVSSTGPEVCSATYECAAPGDIWNSTDGTVALAFDDGPLAPSPRLYQFLKQNNQHATHFFIGGNILANPDIFLQAFDTNGDSIAVHTWTHPYMTIKTNTEVLAELGYTMQIIYDSTGGRVPKFWRPPYGDVDNRVRAIAKEVFGLTTVIWNQDSADWELTNGAIPLATVEASLQSFYKMPKSPGLIILEHELSDNSVNAFMSSWAIMHSQGWTPVTIPDIDVLAGDDPLHAWYQNALNDTAEVVSMSFGTGEQSMSVLTGPAPSGSAASPSATPSGGASVTQSVTNTFTTSTIFVTGPNGGSGGGATSAPVVPTVSATKSGATAVLSSSPMFAVVLGLVGLALGVVL